jgi:hypothetical protein
VSIRGLKRPAAKTLQGRTRAGKPELQKFVIIRVNSWFKTTRSEDPAGQISGSKPELQKFVTIRVHSWFKTTRCEEPAGQNSGSKAQATKIRVHSCSFVVQNNPQRSPFRADLGLESPSYRNSCPFVVNG